MSDQRFHKPRIEIFEARDNDSLTNGVELSKEFYPKDSWASIEELLTDPYSLSDPPYDGELDASKMEELVAQINSAFLRSSANVQANSNWVQVRETVSPQHRVDLEITPNGLNRHLDVTLDMGQEDVGLENKIIGKSVQSVPFAVSFIAKKVPPKHPLFSYGGRQLSAKVSIKNVYKPPFKLPTLEKADSGAEFSRHLLDVLRSLPFSLAEEMAKSLRAFPIDGAKAKSVVRAASDFLNDYAGIPNHFRKRTVQQIKDIGAVYDPEMELSFMESVYRVYLNEKNRYSPPAFHNHIEQLFNDRFKVILDDVFAQLTQQQKDVRQKLVNFAEVENERQRLAALKGELDALRKKEASDEVLKRTRQDLTRVAERIRKRIRQYESSKGMILMQELFISTMEKSEAVGDIISRSLPKALEGLKSLLKANHISAARDIEALSQSLGVHAQHLLIQHAIYSEVEPDLSQIVSLESIKTYDADRIKPVLNLMPTLRENLGDEELTSTNILKAVIESGVPKNELNAFENFCQEHPEPSQPEVQRFSYQLNQFVDIGKSADGIDGMVTFLEKELLTLKVVLKFAAEQGKLNTDFKNHLKYYEQLYLAPYLDLLEQAGHKAFEELDRAYGKLENALKVSMEIRYTSLEEKALLAMFRHVQSQLQKKNLFTAKVFTQQIKSFMNQLTRFKRSVPNALMKKILASYTVYMMGSSRLMNLSRESSGEVKSEDLAKIREGQKDLTSES